MIIDSHSHFGRDFYCGKISIEEYISCCNKIGVTTGFLMPSPWPIYTKDCKEITSLIWEHQNYVNKRYFRLEDGTNKIEIFKNPYYEVNYSYNDFLKNVDSSVNLMFVPLMHGVLDNAEYFEKMLDDINPPAVKIHNFGSGFSIDKINMDLVDIIRSKNIPLIIHTSVYNYDYGYGASTRYFRNECHPYLWAKFLVENNIRGVLNHGACLNKEAINLVNSSDNLMIGIGPDLDISRDFFKVDIEKDVYLSNNYLCLLKNISSANKLLFDIDFNWNLDGEKYDVQQINRLIEIWNTDEIEKILCKNALQFFGLHEHNCRIRKHR